MDKIQFARNLLSHHRAIAAKVVALRFSLTELEAQDVVHKATCYTGYPLAYDWWMPTPVHGDGWWYANDTWGYENHWACTPQEQLEEFQRDTLIPW